MNCMSRTLIDIESKICSRHDFLGRVASLPRPLVMTNGVFDVLHRGHVSYLRQAAKLGASLFVAVNSDSSVRLLGKGPDRPINSADDRAYVLAGLESVDLLTVFDARTPIELIKAIRPDVYVKGGDYKMDALAETHAVRSWGGSAVAIPFVDGFSTTSLVGRIRQARARSRKAAFLDRDGVINKDKAYVYRWDDFEFVPGAIQGMLRLQSAGYALVIVTNQAGIARGYYTEEQYQALSNSLRKHLTECGVELAGIYHCPHHPHGSVKSLARDCDCRKPKPGLLIQAAHDLGIDMSRSLLIGDKQTDIQAARAAGVSHAYSVDSENAETLIEAPDADGHFASLLDCVTHILAGTSGESA
jgi:rfaE bifunctional protein nucleotidyltransferase chain/domain